MGRPEHDHERGVIAPLYGGLGFDVFATSIRAKPIGATPGIADLYVTAGRLSFSFWHEVKVGKYRQSIDQRNFMFACEAARVPYVLGDVEDANAFLCWLGIAERAGSTIRFLPRHAWVARPPLELVQWYNSSAHREAVQKWGYREPAGRAIAARIVHERRERR